MNEPPPTNIVAMTQLNHMIPDASYTVIYLYVIQGEGTFGNARFLTQDWRGGRT